MRLSSAFRTNLTFPKVGKKLHITIFLPFILLISSVWIKESHGFSVWIREIHDPCWRRLQIFCLDLQGRLGAFWKNIFPRGLWLQFSKILRRSIGDFWSTSEENRQKGEQKKKVFHLVNLLRMDQGISWIF
jgi:hypothetical protein